MATTSLWRIKGYIGKLILYAINSEKTARREIIRTGNDDTDPDNAMNDLIGYVSRDNATESLHFVTGLNCAINTAKEEMMAYKIKYNKCGGTVAYHGYQSFAQGEVSPELAHRIGVELANELWGDKYQVIVATHTDKASHIHNHFVINTVSFLDGKKFHRTKKDYCKMREVSDRLCRENGLSVIKKPSGKGINYGEWKAEQEGNPTVRGIIREAIDVAVKASQSTRQFLDFMDQMGFIIDQRGKYPKIKQAGSERFVRFRSLGPGYDNSDIIDRIYANNDPELPEKVPQEDPQQIFEDEDERVDNMTYISLYRCYNRALVAVKERPKANMRIYYLVRRDTSAMRLYMDSLDLVVDHGLKTGEDVMRYKEEAMRKIDENIRLRNDMRNALRRALRAGDDTEAGKARYNIDIYNRRLAKLRREITTCDEVLERSKSVRDNLRRIENNDLRGMSREKEQTAKTREKQI